MDLIRVTAFFLFLAAGLSLLVVIGSCALSGDFSRKRRQNKEARESQQRALRAYLDDANSNGSLS